MRMKQKMTAKGKTNAMESMISNKLCLRTKNYEAFSVSSQITIFRTMNAFGQNERENKLLDIGK